MREGRGNEGKEETTRPQDYWTTGPEDGLWHCVPVVLWSCSLVVFQSRSPVVPWSFPSPFRVFRVFRGLNSRFQFRSRYGCRFLNCSRSSWLRSSKFVWSSDPASLQARSEAVTAFSNSPASP